MNLFWKVMIYNSFINDDATVRATDNVLRQNPQRGIR